MLADSQVIFEARMSKGYNLLPEKKREDEGEGEGKVKRERVGENRRSV